MRATRKRGIDLEHQSLGIGCAFADCNGLPRIGVDYMVDHDHQCLDRAEGRILIEPKGFWEHGERFAEAIPSHCYRDVDVPVKGYEDLVRYLECC